VKGGAEKEDMEKMEEEECVKMLINYSTRLTVYMDNE